MKFGASRRELALGFALSISLYGHENIGQRRLGSTVDPNIYFHPGSIYEEIKLKGQRLAVLDARTGTVLSLLRWNPGPYPAGEVICYQGGDYRALLEKSRAGLYGTDSSVFSRVVPGGRDGVYLYYRSDSNQPLFVVTQKPAFGYLDLRFVFAGNEHILLAHARRFDDEPYAWNEYDIVCAAGVDALQVYWLAKVSLCCLLPPVP